MATTRFPAEQNPAVDPELPQPAAPQTVEVTSPGEIAVSNTNASVLAALDVGLPSATPQEVPVVESIAPNEQIISTTAPASGYYETGGTGGTAGTVTRVSTTPTDVDAATANVPTGANQSTVNIGTDANRGGNLEAATRERAQTQAALQARFGSAANGDWRVKLRLAPNSDYLYNSNDPGILAPLKVSDGVVFPYMPSIQTTYSANYDSVDLTHSNYRGQFYKSSSVGDIQMTGIFTAQDTVEANYMLAVIHFFKSATKMFYGQDAQRGAPPPLVYLIGLGQYQFSNHPCVIKSFSYNLPTDVDYIRTQPNNYGVNLLNRRAKTVSAPANTIASVVNRLSNALDKLGNPLKRGALPAVPAPGQVSQQSVNNTSNATYVPTKIEIQLTLMPIQTRSQQSQQFSVKEFGNGNLLKGGFW